MNIDMTSTKFSASHEYQQKHKISRFYRHKHAEQAEEKVFTLFLMTILLIFNLRQIFHANFVICLLTYIQPRRPNRLLQNKLLFVSWWWARTKLENEYF